VVGAAVGSGAVKGSSNPTKTSEEGAESRVAARWPGPAAKRGRPPARLSFRYREQPAAGER